MVNEARVQEIVETIIAPRLSLPSGPCRIAALQGDASNRRYYRVRLSGAEAGPSLVLMELAAPEDFKASEEKVSAGTVAVRELPFINILRHLQACRVAVPQLYHYEEPAGWVFLEDLGDATLWELLQGRDPKTLKEYYLQAVDELLKIQHEGSRRNGSDCIAFGRAFDVPLLLWEFDHFLEYGVGVYKGRRLPPGDRQRALELFEGLARSLAAQPRCLTHRDYHSKNLMVRDGQVRVLDFQDALMGPPQYDLASLLRDSYVQLPEDLVQDLLAYYLERTETLGGMSPDRAEFLKLFDYMSIQRNLKAAGRFAYIQAVKKNPGYLPFIPPTLAYVRRNFKKHPELRELQGVLSRYVEELQ